MKVLIAEDDRMLSDMLSARLRTSGFQVLTAYDAMQALMVAVRSVPSVIILDISMPAGTGLDVLAKLKRSNKTALIPVIVLTANADPEMGNTARGLGEIGRAHV